MVHEQDGPDPTPETGTQAAALRDWEQDFLTSVGKVPGQRGPTEECMDIDVVPLPTTLILNFAARRTGSTVGSCIPTQRLQGSSQLYPAVHCVLRKGVSNCTIQSTQLRSHHTKESPNPNKYPVAHQQKSSEKHLSSVGM